MNIKWLFSRRYILELAVLVFFTTAMIIGAYGVFDFVFTETAVEVVDVAVLTLVVLSCVTVLYNIVAWILFRRKRELDETWRKLGGK